MYRNPLFIILFFIPTLLLQANTDDVRSFLLSKNSFTLSGSFAQHDFEDATAAFDWAFTTTKKQSYQLQGEEASNDNIFGWKAVDIAPPEAQWHMFQLGSDVDADGSQKFDWVLVGAAVQAVYKLSGENENGNFQYSEKIDIDYTIENSTISFKKINVSPSLKSEQRPLLVIRVNYNDITFNSSASVWSSKVFGYDPHELNHYYNEISYNHFSFIEAIETEAYEGDGLITVHLNKNHPDSGADSTIHPDLRLALELADPYINYSIYDHNKNGAITPDELLIMFIIAGNEDAFSGSNRESGVWAQQSCLQSAIAPQLDQVILSSCTNEGNFLMFGERHKFDEEDHDATIGIIAHELGHAAFNLPDLYDVSNASAGIGYFGLMGSGMWGKENAADFYGNTPVHMSAWSKLFNKWVTPEIVINATLQDKFLIHTASEEYNIIKLPINETEYFLLENRNIEGYDLGLNALNGEFVGGIAIWHIDEQVINQNLTLNTVNTDKKNKGVDLEEASHPELDTSPSAEGNTKNLYYSGNQAYFSNDTTPNSDQNSGQTSDIVISNISYPSQDMSVTITNPNVE
ncbi:MAG: hypothetical protein DRG24_07835 [Epsilonproteobacteria bacterium]|nr:MAG: hypothetical protein DRG24_07835 [Campylobacterota bacterium]